MKSLRELSDEFFEEEDTKKADMVVKTRLKNSIKKGGSMSAKESTNW